MSPRAGSSASIGKPVPEPFPQTAAALRVDVMALYEFQCITCDRKTEVMQRFSDPSPTKCPHCGGVLKKLLSSPAVQFKGSGFYATDYGKPGGKPEDSAKGKEGDSSKGKERDGGASSEAGAGTQGDSAGDFSKEKKDSKDSSKEGDSSKGKSDSGPSGAASTGAKPEAPGSRSSPSKKNTRRK
ncbi:MAG: FmdB family zinc ribbon protein [Thermoanaerobaculia bacterium]